ncbi:MAG: methylenetetrahydrofolate reductase C-terminal domain-containing protein [Planctomycetes bacterium]|nr:methylenetetrahydrofolate reductase C-terminal domain-containing protein [Planctomycetota bacterium]
MFDTSKAQSFFHRALTVLERHIKVPLFDCSMCGQCILRSTAMVCPMRCPKQMRNGPCGGSVGGKCEVFRERDCVWAVAYRKFQGKGDGERLRELQPLMDWRLWGTSAWLNVSQKRIDTQGHAISEAVNRGWR